MCENVISRGENVIPRGENVIPWRENVIPCANSIYIDLRNNLITSYCFVFILHNIYLNFLLNFLFLIEFDYTFDCQICYR